MRRWSRWWTAGWNLRRTDRETRHEGWEPGRLLTPEDPTQIHRSDVAELPYPRYLSPLAVDGRRTTHVLLFSHSRLFEFIVGSSNKARPPFPTVSQYYHWESHMRKCNLLIVSSTVSETVKMLTPLQLESPCWFYFTCPSACGSAANVPLWDRTHSLPTSFWEQFYQKWWLFD